MRKGQKLVNWVIINKVKAQNPEYPAKAWKQLADDHMANVERYIFYMSDAEFEQALSE